MRTLVTGGAGFVGRQLASSLSERGHTVAVTVHHTAPSLDGVSTFSLDVRDEGRVTEVIRSFTPDAVVHAAALTDADECERNPERARAINVAGTEAVAAGCEQSGANLVFISSSFVFSGEADIYFEDDDRDPVNVYGETKATAEDVVNAADCPSTVVRTDQPYGWPKPWQPSTMVTWVLDALADDGRVSVFDDWWNNPIYNPDLVEAICVLLEGRHTGTVHAVGPDFLNRYDWARRIAAVFDEDTDRIERSSAADSPLPAERPNARLSNEKLRTEFGVEPLGIDDGLERLAAERPPD